MCEYCNQDKMAKDIFFKYLKINPFGVDDDDLNPDISVFVDNEEKKMKMTVCFGDLPVMKESIDIKFCPFCGRRL